MTKIQTIGKQRFFNKSGNKLPLTNRAPQDLIYYFDLHNIKKMFKFGADLIWRFSNFAPNVPNLIHTKINTNKVVTYQR